MEQPEMSLLMKTLARACPESLNKGRPPYAKAGPELHASAVMALPLHQGKDLMV